MKIDAAQTLNELKLILNFFDVKLIYFSANAFFASSLIDGK
jgi:hypothetical protein